MPVNDYFLPPDGPPETYRTYGERIRAKMDAAHHARDRWHTIEEELKRLIRDCPHESKRTMPRPGEPGTHWECEDCGHHFPPAG